MNKRSPITTHILDLSVGKAAHHVPVILEQLTATGQWKKISERETNADGRVEDLMPLGTQAQAGVYRLIFNTVAYFKNNGTTSFYPDVTVSFQLSHPEQHHHIPLLLSPFGYSTYRGT